MGQTNETTTPGGSSGASGVGSTADNVYFDADNRQTGAQDGGKVAIGAWGRIVPTAIDPGVRGVERRHPEGDQAASAWWSTTLRAWCWNVVDDNGRTCAYGEARTQSEAQRLADLHARKLYALPEEVPAGGVS